MEGVASEEAADFALRTQQVIAHETGIADIIDAFGGSYYLEWLTDQIEREASGHIRAVEDAGGLHTDSGREYFLGEIQRSNAYLEQAVESGEKVIIGVNKYSDAPDETPSVPINRDVQERQRARLAAERERRDESALRVALQQLQKAVETGENLMPSILECVRASGTVGEIAGVMRMALEPRG
jgi:methylmalonyl-CoA mutase N-terminal domain/subunit